MLMCLVEDCTCVQHRLLDCLKTKQNEEAKSLLRKLEYICELTDSSGWTLLHHSVEFGNAEMTQHLIDEGCNVNAQDDSGVTPLMLAIRANDTRTVEMLLKNNADIYLTDCDGKSSLELAFSTFRFEAIGQPRPILVKFTDNVNKDFVKGSLTQFLLNANDELKLAIVVFENAEVAKFVLDSGYPIDFREPQRGFTALHCAIAYARVENAKILIEHGANVDALDEQDHPALYYYTKYCQDSDENSELLKMFLKHSNRLSSPTFHDFSDVENILFLGKEKTVKAVLLSEVDVDACLNGNKTVLDHLIANNNLDNLDFLEELGIEYDVDECSEYEETYLMKAAFYAYPRKVDYFLRRGADVNFFSPTLRRSALSRTIYRCWPTPELERDVAKTMELLLEHGADAQSFIIDRPYSMENFSVFAKVIVVHLAMFESTLTDLSRGTIESNPQLKDYFDSCVKQLDEMKNFVVYGTVTLFELLTEEEEKLIPYTRNEELLSAMIGAMENLSHLEPYYLNILRRRLSRGQEVAKLQKKAAQVIQELTGLHIEAYSVFVYQIISYLDGEDLRNLWQIDIHSS